jgi:acetolactate synthase-1/2/3 large subunit
VGQLVEFCERLAIPVIESNASYMNFPGNHPLHLGFLGGDLLSDADVILTIDADVPWVPTLKRPEVDCRVFCIDIDPLKSDIPLWHVPAVASYQADSYFALTQLNQYAKNMQWNDELIKSRRDRCAQIHRQLRHKWKEKETRPANGVITPEWLAACLRNVIDDETVVMNETITNAMAVSQGLPRNKPGTVFANGGSSLGWSGGAALGAKLASPDKTVVSLVGDGSYIFSIPSAVYWMSRRYQAPFLTVIYNNNGWNATKNNYLKLYPDGVAHRDDRYWVNFDQPADLAGIAEAAGGALALTVSDPDQLQEALEKGMEAVKSGRSAVIDVQLPRISHQKDL